MDINLLLETFVTEVVEFEDEFIYNENFHGEEKDKRGILLSNIK